MEIIKGAITSLSSRGYITLQIPHYTIGKPGMKVETEEVPDNWLVFLHSNKTPSVGKELGFTYLTRVGWEANKDKIKEAYENAKCPRGPWTKFEAHAEEHFNEVERQTTRKVRLLEKKLGQLKESMLTWFCRKITLEGFLQLGLFFFCLNLNYLLMRVKFSNSTFCNTCTSYQCCRIT